MKIDSVAISKDCLVWFPEYGMGYHTAKPMEYQDDYWENYIKLDASDMGEALTNARVDFVSNYWAGELVDIGIGAGRFVIEADCTGFDVNKKAIQWLKSHGLYQDPYRKKVQAITCWDSLEHIPEPEKLINQVEKYVFVSMPIYKDADDVLQSKHFKPSEHLYYWTHDGLIRWFHALGFAYVTHNDMESNLGREGIKTYAFKRRGA